MTGFKIILLNLFFILFLMADAVSADCSSASSLEESQPVCPDGEEFSNCTQNVNRRINCSQQGQPIVDNGEITEECQSGCVCQAGFLRTNDGDCVLESQCYGDLVCDESEVVNTCPKGCINDFCPEYEGDDGGCPKDQEQSDSCGEPVCTCRFNYKRNVDGTCIPTRECPPFDCSSRPNEEFDSCPPRCPSDSCKQASPTGRCPIYGRIGIILQCEPTCRCIKGYWRDNGTCVAYAECPGICPTNEKYSTCIQAACRTLNCSQKGQSVACPRVIKGSCQQGCVCAEGFLRAENGSCIPEEQCPDSVCPPNEKLSSCTQIECRALNCSQKGQPIACPGISEGSCLQGCVCAEGFLRDEQGSCIPEQQCPTSVCPTNEKLSSCTQIECRALNCSQKGQAIACPGISEGSCLQGCVCAEGFLRNDQGSCIPEQQCPASVCPPNEKLSSCTQIECRALNCSQKGQPIACPGISEGSCLQGCVCAEGFLRDEQGSCIPEQQCPNSVCPTNEKFSSCTQIECRALNCSQKGQPVACPGISEGSCLEGCICSDGYLRDEQGSCIPEQQCPTSVCPPNEKLSSCTQIECRALNCSQKGQPVACPGISEGSCLQGCVCAEGFLRDEQGSCIPEQQCRTGICPTNEKFSSCTQIECRALNCSQKGQPVACPGISEGSCVQGCICADGYLRDEQGSCIPEQQCPTPTCGDDEVLTQCPNVCAPVKCTSLKEEQDKKKDCISAAVCRPSECWCFPGYRRNADGTCIPIEECPNICPTNEEYSDCAEKLCQGSESENQEASSDNEDCSCQAGCVCKDGLTRNENGNCVSENQCQGDSE